MELSEIIKTGTVDRKGINKINELIEENKKLKESFAYSYTPYAYIGTKYYTKKDLMKEITGMYEEQKQGREKLRKKLLAVKSIIVMSKRKVKTKDILKIINDE